MHDARVQEPFELPELTPDQAAAATDPAAAAALLAATGAPPRFSYSALATFDACPFRFALRYLLRIPGPPSVAAFSFGTAAHAAFERFTRERREAVRAGTPAPGRPDLDRYLDEAWTAVTFPDAESEERYRARTGPLLDAFWAIESVTPGDVIREEQRFRLAIEPADGSATVQLTGSIDRIDRLPGGAVEVIDYKTGSPASQEDVDDNLQLSIYAMACRDGMRYGRPGRVTLWFAEHGDRRSTVRSDEAIDAARVAVLDRVARIRAGAFLATPSEPTCRWCDYRPICPSAVP